MAYDSHRGVTVLFGGSDADGVASGETWEYDGSAWSLRQVGSGPAPISRHSMAYDEGRGVTVLMGGGRSEAWEWDGLVWAQMFPQPKPPNRFSMGMDYDALREVTVLFGGLGSDAMSSAGTLEYSGDDLSMRMLSNRPSRRFAAAMAYDSRRHVTVLFGGENEVGDPDNQTWEYDGNTWTRRFPADSPSGREYSAMAFDSRRGVMVLFGGYTADDFNDETWEYDGADWTRKFPGTVPPARSGHAMAYDGARAVTVMFGGEDLRTWKWDGARWFTESPPPPHAHAIASGLELPTCIAAPASDPAHIFLCESTGRIRVIGTASGQQEPEPFLDVSAMVDAVFDVGLIGLAFDPHYAANGLFYIAYIAGPIPNVDPNWYWVLARYHADPDGLVAEPASRLEVLRVLHPQFGHSGGWLGFSPVNGYLYASVGDGTFGHPPDPENRAQTIVNELQGKMLRLDVTGSPYSVPPTNPFVGTAADPEIWAYGLRNPWRCSFDRSTGDLYIADVGEDSWEEIDFEPAASPGGRNYGWRCMEADQCTGLGGCAVPCDDPSLIPPMYAYPHSEGQSVIGGYVYRGSAIPDYQGLYLFADWSRSRVWTLRAVGGEVQELRERTEELRAPGEPAIAGISAFGEDAAGELYMCSYNTGTVWKIVPPGCGPVIDQHPVGGEVLRGQTVFLGVEATAPDPIAYAWRKDGVPLSDDGRISGATTASLTISDAGYADAGAYDAVLTIPCGSSMTFPAQITVRCPADFNGDGSRTVADIFGFLMAWFERDAIADFNDSDTVDLTDLFEFLAAWFVGCG